MFSDYILPNYIDDTEFIDQISKIEYNISNKRKFDNIEDNSMCNFLKLFSKEIQINYYNKLEKIYSNCGYSLDTLSQNIEFQDALKYIWEIDCKTNQINIKYVNKMFDDILYLIPRLGLSKAVINTKNSIDYIYNCNRFLNKNEIGTGDIVFLKKKSEDEYIKCRILYIKNNIIYYCNFIEKNIYKSDFKELDIKMFYNKKFNKGYQVEILSMPNKFNGFEWILCEITNDNDYFYTVKPLNTDSFNNEEHSTYNLVLPGMKFNNISNFYVKFNKDIKDNYFAKINNNFCPLRILSKSFLSNNVFTNFKGYLIKYRRLLSKEILFSLYSETFMNDDTFFSIGIIIGTIDETKELIIQNLDNSICRINQNTDFIVIDEEYIFSDKLIEELNTNLIECEFCYDLLDEKKIIEFCFSNLEINIEDDDGEHVTIGTNPRHNNKICMDCLRKYIELHFNTYKTSYICKCPIPGCDRDLQNIVLKELLSDQLLNDIDNRMKNDPERIKELDEFTLPAGLEAKHCPTCRTPIIKSEGCNSMICGGCGNDFDYSSAETVKTT